jgi:hypothetical protein
VIVTLALPSLPTMAQPQAGRDGRTMLRSRTRPATATPTVHPKPQVPVMACSHLLPSVSR